jgi:hypothetical protein
VVLLALTIDERAIILAALEDPPDGLAELRAVLLNEHEWCQRGSIRKLPATDPPGGFGDEPRGVVQLAKQREAHFNEAQRGGG